MSENQLPESFRELFEEATELYNNGANNQRRNNIPDTTDIPIEDKSRWLEIPDVICVYVDMRSSTELSARNYVNSTARIYQLFTGTAVEIFHELEAPYIDLKGDGVFALFDSNQPYRALVSAITFKTFVQEVFDRKIRSISSLDGVGGTYGIDQNTLLVRKIGLKIFADRTDRQNEVWAGRTVNMASKLASDCEAGELRVSDRFFEKVDHEFVSMSCGCPGQEKRGLWSDKDVTDEDKYDFSKVWALESNWCQTHGEEYFEKILNLDD